MKINTTQVQEYLTGVDYPATKNTIIDQAMMEGADDDVVQALQKLPEHDYLNEADVGQELRKIVSSS